MTLSSDGLRLPDAAIPRQPGPGTLRHGISHRTVRPITLNSDDARSLDSATSRHDGPDSHRPPHGPDALVTTLFLPEIDQVFTDQSPQPFQSRNASIRETNENVHIPTRLHTSEEAINGRDPSPQDAADQSSRPKLATEIIADSPWGFTKAGKARKRLEQACVSCRRKKTKCEPVISSSKCSLCEKNSSLCHFDNA
jgi:hypothetical protein